MKRVVIVLGLSLIAAVAVAAVYREGKTVMDKDCKVEVVKMKWGLKDEGTDRLLGTARLYVEDSQAYDEVVLVFDTFDKTSEKLDTLDVSFTLKRYGYKRGRGYIEGEFCVDFAHPEGAQRITLSNVKLARAPVTYKMKFNISGSLSRTRFKLPEPKVMPGTS